MPSPSAARSGWSYRSSVTMRSWALTIGSAHSMTVDASAVFAILQDEAERIEFVSLIEQSPRRLISTVSVLEAAMVLEGRKGDDAGADLDLFLQWASIETVAFDREQLLAARDCLRVLEWAKTPELN